ncbi:MAG TPA: CAP domain-containing protein [Actinomycetes bacterium]|nr:CAP domain-containing protein [Actinomycetes bacterium]
MVAVGLAAIAIVAALLVPAAWRSIGSDVEASGEAGSLLTLVNSARANNGLAPLDYASDLSAIANERALIMARTGALSHTPDLGGRACCWTWIGENVAFASSVQGLHDVLMNSAPHRANILNADADDVGIAVVRGNGSLWAAQIFRARSDADRADAAGSGSRDGDRSEPTTTYVPSEGSTGSTSSEPTLTKAQLLAIQLRANLADARDRLRAERKKHGPFDPVRAAVRYRDTLDLVTD